MKRLTGSISPIRPSSISINTATLVIALVCDAIRKRLSVVIFTPASLSRQPKALSYTGFPSCSTSATAPAIWFLSTNSCSTGSSRARRPASTRSGRIDGAAGAADWAIGAAARSARAAESVSDRRQV